MNKWISTIRVGIGVIAGASLLLLASLSDAIKQGTLTPNTLFWETAIFLGLIGGFAERLVPTLFRQTVEKIESPGTPVGAITAKEGDVLKGKPLKRKMRTASQKTRAGTS